MKSNISSQTYPYQFFYLYKDKEYSLCEVTGTDQELLYIQGYNSESYDEGYREFYKEVKRKYPNREVLDVRLYLPCWKITYTLLNEQTQEKTSHTFSQRFLCYEEAIEVVTLDLSFDLRSHFKLESMEAEPTIYRHE